MPAAESDEQAKLLAANIRRSNVSTVSTVTSQEFWMSCMVQDLTLESKDEVGKMSVFVKFHVVAPHFLASLREERVMLVGHGFAGLSGPDAARKVEGFDRDIIHGVQLDHPSADLFPVNPLHIWRNESAKHATAMHMRDHLCWARYDISSALLSVQLAFQVAVAAPLDFRRFPFDRHIVPMQLATRSKHHHNPS